MPFYEYQCTNCETVVSIFHSIKETITPLCPNCPCNINYEMNQVIGTPGFKLDGDGFYDPGMH